jgi:PAS domain S-box-containing protein
MRGRLNLRERLLILMVAAMLPLFALSLWLALRESRSATELAQSQLRLSASLLASNQDRAVDAAEQLLGAIAAVPDLRSTRGGRCQRYFERLRDRYPMYANIGLISLDGEMLCHASARTGNANIADRAYFQEALSQRRFVMGEPIVGRVTRRRTIPFSLPLIEGGRVTGVVFAMLDLEQASRELARVALPLHARVMVADRHARVLMEYPPSPSRAVPRELIDPKLLAAARTMSGGVGEDFDLSGEARVFAFAPSRLVGNEGFIIRVGIARSSVVSGASAYLRDALLVSVITLLAAIGVTWWLGGRVIVEPARLILGAVRQLERGRLDARVPLQPGAQRGEFSRIAAAFNLMAESLHLRQIDLQTELGRSRSAYGVLDLILNSMQEGLVAVTTTGQFLICNEAAARLFPLDGPPLIPQQWAEHMGFFHVDGVTPYVTEEVPLIRAALGESGRQQLLVVRNSLVPEGRLLQCSWQPIQGEHGISGGLVVFTDVTELQRLQAEQAAQFEQLRDAQRKLIYAQRIARMGNWELDLRSGRLWWSDEVYALFGITRDQFDGSLIGLADKVHPDDRHLLKPARDSALRDGQVMSVEFRVVRPDGSIVWMHEIAEARRNEEGEPVWFGGMVQDITTRKLSEQALLDSERELHGYTLLLQRAAEAAQAITRHPELRETLQEVADQARAVIETRHAQVHLVGVANGQAELRSFSGDDDRHSLAGESLAVPLVSRSGQHIGQLCLSGKEQGAFTQRDQYVAMELAQLASIAIDNARLFTEIRELNASLEARITQRTAELARQELLYRTLAEQAPEVIWNTDARGSVTFLNQAWYTLVGGQRGEGLGRGWLARVHPEDVAAGRENWLRSQQTLQPYTGTRRVLASDGGYHTMSYKAAPVLDDQGQVAFWVGIDTDITEMKAIERALRTSNRELEAFSYSVSHDLRAPLGAIGGFSRALALKLEAHPDERVQHYLARVRAGVEKMENLIEALLSLAKVVRAPLSFGAVDLSAIARETFEGLQMQQPERVVSVRVQEALVAQGDARLLRLVIENLVGNAWKFTSGTDPAVIEVGKLDNGNVFFVRDNGVGFEMAYAGKLFSAFQRLHTEAEFPGTGIGLATVRRIVARHQGRVWARSQPGGETTFFFALSESVPPAWLVGDDATV